jgi:ERCC4-related helicase
MTNTEVSGRNIGRDKWIDVLSSILEKMIAVKEKKREVQTMHDWQSIWYAAKAIGIPRPLIAENISVPINILTYLTGSKNRGNMLKFSEGKKFVIQECEKILQNEAFAHKLLCDATNKYYDKIVDIRVSEPDERYVYDLQIDGTHNFVTGNGILCHNTIVGGEIAWKLFGEGKLRRMAWIVPTGPLVKQVIDEMSGRYGLHGIGITGESMTRQDRIGDPGNTDVTKTVYGKNGFVVMTWSMYVKDFTGKTYDLVTRLAWFDLIVLDEGHRSQQGNKAFDAVMNVISPYRVILSGTIMPNGDWRELHGMVSSVAPMSVMASWHFTRIEEKKMDEMTLDKNVEKPRHEAKKAITSIIMPSLLRRVARHVKEDYAAFLPSIGETSVHVATNDVEENIIGAMIDMLSETISEWQSMPRLKSSTKDERKYITTVENAKNILWQDLRRFCSHGAFSLERRMEEIIAGDSPVNAWLKEHFEGEMNRVHDLLASPGVRLQPKNPKVLDTINHLDPERCIVFNDSVRGCIELSRYLKENGKEVRVIVGSDDQMTDDDADVIGQSSNIDDNEIARILEWFWFPWVTITKLSTIDDTVDVTYISSKGEKKKNVYYVDAHKLGKVFSIEITWNKGIRKITMESIKKMIDTIAGSPSVVIDAEIPAKIGTTGKIIIAVRFTKRKDHRVLVTMDKLNEGANIQIANLIIFYDQPMSIKQKEQRVARARRMESMNKSIGLVSIMCGLDYAIDRTLGMKYETAKQLGYPDPSPISMNDVLKLMKSKKFRDEMPGKSPVQTNIVDLVFGGKKE